MIGIKKEDGGLHAVLATKLTVLQEQGEAVFEVHDNNIPGTTWDLSYDVVEDKINPFFQYFNVIEAFATVNVDDIPFSPDLSFTHKFWLHRKRRFRTISPLIKRQEPASSASRRPFV